MGGGAVQDDFELEMKRSYCSHISSNLSLHTEKQKDIIKRIRTERAVRLWYTEVYQCWTSLTRWIMVM